MSRKSHLHRQNKKVSKKTTKIKHKSEAQREQCVIASRVYYRRLFSPQNNNIKSVTAAFSLKSISHNSDISLLRNVNLAITNLDLRIIVILKILTFSKNSELISCKLLFEKLRFVWKSQNCEILTYILDNKFISQYWFINFHFRTFFLRNASRNHKSSNAQM